MHTAGHVKIEAGIVGTLWRMYVLNEAGATKRVAFWENELHNKCAHVVQNTVCFDSVLS